MHFKTSQFAGNSIARLEEKCKCKDRRCKQPEKAGTIPFVIPGK
jgi:hypothetical protein